MDDLTLEAGALRRVTLRDVAREVGVTESTASSVLNGAKSGTRVSPATRERLQTAALRLGYRPNELARSLRRSQTRLLGFFAHFEFLSSRNAFLSELVGGVQEAAVARGYDLVLYAVPVDRPVDETVRHLADRRVDGLLFFAPYEPELFGLVASTGLPTVGLVDTIPGMPTVTVNDAEGGRLLARHLHEKGHRSVLYRGWHHEPPSARDRRRGFHEEAARLGMSVAEGRTIDPEFRAALTESEVDAIANGVTAIACWGDPTAERTCDALVEAGFRVPQDVAVTGFNGLPHETTPKWSLTTVRADWRAVGARGVEKLLSSLHPGSESPADLGTPDPHHLVPVALAPGATT